MKKKKAKTKSNPSEKPDIVTRAAEKTCDGPVSEIEKKWVFAIGVRKMAVPLFLSDRLDASNGGASFSGSEIDDFKKAGKIAIHDCGCRLNPKCGFLPVVVEAKTNFTDINAFVSGYQEVSSGEFVFDLKKVSVLSPGDTNEVFVRELKRAISLAVASADEVFMAAPDYDLCENLASEYEDEEDICFGMA